MTSDAGLTSHELQRRAREDEERKKAAADAPVETHTLTSLLEAAGLEHLHACLVDKTSLDEMQSRLLANRPLFLEFLRGHGVDKLGERQKLANQIGKAEKAGQLPNPVRRYPHLEPPVFDEEGGSKEVMTVRLKVPAGTSPNQLKVAFDFDRLTVKYCGGVTSATGKLSGTVRPTECTWQIERAAQPEYDPMADAAEQPDAPDDTLAVSLQKEESGGWKTLFTDSVARRYVAPPKPKTERELAMEARDKEVQKEKDKIKHDILYGRAPINFKPRKMDLGGTTPHWRSHRTKVGETGSRNGYAGDDAPSLTARDHWQTARATMLWREGAVSFDGAPDHPEDSAPFYTWTETEAAITLRAQTERGLPSSALSLKAKRSSVECHVRGRATPWCGFLVGHVDPSRCTLEVVPCVDAAAVSDTLQLTLAKAAKAQLWRAPWPELLAAMEVRERRSNALQDRPRRSVLMASGGWDEMEKDGIWEIVIAVKHGLAPDDFRVGITTNPSALNLHVVGQEDEPIIGGQLWGTLDPERSSWHIRAAKPKGSMKIDEIVLNLAKEKGSVWRGFFKKHYV